MMYAVTIHHGDMREVLQQLPAASVDACVTDPPYGLAFMGSAWDRAVPGQAYWRDVHRVLRPGGHLLAFGGSRTVPRSEERRGEKEWFSACRSWGSTVT